MAAGVVIGIVPAPGLTAVRLNHTAHRTPHSQIAAPARGLCACAASVVAGL